VTISAAYLKTLQVGEIQVYENLAIFPLLSAEFEEPGYVLLDEALARGQSKSVKKESARRRSH